MGTGQYDYNIYQTLMRIEDLLESVDVALDGVGTVINTISEYWLPIACVSLLVISVFTVIKWVVKL